MAGSGGVDGLELWGAGGDVVVGCSAGYSFASLELWSRSLLECGFDGQRVLICRRTSTRTVNAMRDLGFIVVAVDALARSGWPRVHTNEDMSVDRFYFVWHLLRHMPPERHRFLILTDVRDVVFQEDPRVWLEANLDDKDIVVGSESIALANEEWNDSALRKAFNEGIHGAMRNRVGYNAGVIGGRFAAVRDLALNVFLVAPGSRVQYSDQPALNVLLSLAPYRDRTLLARQSDAWACHAGVTADPALLALLRRHLTEPEPVLGEDGVVRTADGRTFAIVHQYDRVPSWSESFQKRFGVRPPVEQPVRAGPVMRSATGLQRQVVRVRRRLLR